MRLFPQRHLPALAVWKRPSLPPGHNVGPDIVDLLGRELVPPRRHGLLALGYRGLEPALVVVGKLPQVVDSGAGRDHVAAMAVNAIPCIELLALCSVLCLSTNTYSRNRGEQH